MGRQTSATWTRRLRFAGTENTDFLAASDLHTAQTHTLKHTHTAYLLWNSINTHTHNKCDDTLTFMSNERCSEYNPSHTFMSKYTQTEITKLYYRSISEQEISPDWSITLEWRTFGSTMSYKLKHFICLLNLEKTSHQEISAGGQVGFKISLSFFSN